MTDVRLIMIGDWIMMALVDEGFNENSIALVSRVRLKQ
jgi:hypothetical protein